jgi:hypothetical protein
MTAVREVDVPRSLAEFPSKSRRAFLVDRGGRTFSVFLTLDAIEPGDDRWHLSIAGQDGEVPAWDDVAALAHRLRPGVTFVLGVPPKSWWLNVHPGCLHLWQTKDGALDAQWRAERRGDTPS